MPRHRQTAKVARGKASENLRARRARGALPIALLCTALFLWDIGEGLFEVTKDRDWHYLRLIGSSMAPAFLWHFVLVFVHKERALGKWRIALYAASAIFTLSSGASSGASGGMASTMASSKSPVPAPWMPLTG